MLVLVSNQSGGAGSDRLGRSLSHHGQSQFLGAVINYDYTLLSARVSAPSFVCWGERDHADTAGFRAELMTRPRASRVALNKPGAIIHRSVILLARANGKMDDLMTGMPDKAVAFNVPKAGS
ncbi:MAG: hypothetical protein KME27_11780 [Lyngbya sp. HA4199-MV5]|nr:hypothetical protein [Lyngbya sp. HA4199-MV5]